MPKVFLALLKGQLLLHLVSSAEDLSEQHRLTKWSKGLPEPARMFFSKPEGPS